MQIQKIYLSRAQTRAMALEHPIGDPTGGAAYGEKNDPVSAVLSVAAMGSTYAAAGTLAAMTLTQGLVFAGAALSLVGNITGNKTLSKIGMVAGIAGGVGMLAETITGSTFGGETRVGDLAGETVRNAPSASAERLVGTPPPADTVTQNAGTSVVENGTQAVQGGGAPTGGTPVATANVLDPNAPKTIGDFTRFDRALEAGAQLPLSEVPAAAPTANNILDPNAPKTTGDFARYDRALNQVPNTPAPPAAANNPGLVKSVLDGIKGNPMAAYIAAQGVAGVGNYMSAKDERDYQAQLAAQRRARLNAGYQGVNQGIVVTPQMAVPVNPQQFAAQQIQPAGLIAGARA